MAKSPGLATRLSGRAASLSLGRRLPPAVESAAASIRNREPRQYGGPLRRQGDARLSHRACIRRAAPATLAAADRWCLAGLNPLQHAVIVADHFCRSRYRQRRDHGFPPLAKVCFAELVGWAFDWRHDMNSLRLSCTANARVGGDDPINRR
jgi:hypothetical protein